MYFYIKYIKTLKPSVHLSCFSPQWSNEIHQPAIHHFYRPFSPHHPKTPKGKLLVLFRKIVTRKNDCKQLNPLFSLSIKQPTRLSLDVRALQAPGHAVECIGKAMFHGKQHALSLLYLHYTSRMRI